MALSPDPMYCTPHLTPYHYTEHPLPLIIISLGYSGPGHVEASSAHNSQNELWNPWIEFCAARAWKFEQWMGVSVLGLGPISIPPPSPWCPFCFPFLSARSYRGHTHRLHDEYYVPCMLCLACVICPHQLHGLAKVPREGILGGPRASLSWSSYLVDIGRGWQRKPPAMDLKDNCGHHPQTPAVDFKLREGREVAFIKRSIDHTELLPPHRVALLKGKQGHDPDESGSQNMAPQEGSAFGNTGTEPSMGQKEACLHIFLPGLARVHKGLREKGRG